NTRGFPYCFLYNVKSYAVVKPDGYSESEVKEWIESEKLEEKEQSVKPNVVFIMCEAFSDLSDEAAFAYSEEDDPLRDFKTVCASDRAVSGHAVVSNVNAGTANTEFDVITGMQTNMVSPTNTSSLRVIRRAIPTLARTYASQGYRNFFIHPGYSWFYNRHSAYDHMGISDQIFNDAFGKEDYKGTMISDAAFFEKFKTNFESRAADGDPIFVYGVTIQNHQSYKYGKFGDTPEDAPFTVNVSDETKESVSVYLEGVRDSSALVLRLAEYFDSIDEPTVLVFFGDHRPSLGGGMTAYNELGLNFGDSEDPELTIRTYETPYVIYCNQAYADAVDVKSAIDSLDLGEGSVISDIYLGAAVYELTGMQGKDGYYDYLTKARRILPVICRESYLLPDGTYTREISEDEQAVVEKLHKWLYYRLTAQPATDF
ncbi:MAG: LTA synthase family protein, partial [Clostridia bacterium]|nr:LTA synthase family protein [Clostridia bacterium]